MKIPNGYDEVLATYGNVHQYIRADGTLSGNWERYKIVRVPLPEPLALAWSPEVEASRVAVHVLVADAVEAILKRIHCEGNWAKLVSYGGGYQFRSVRGRPDRLSMHAFGVALDFDPVHNRLGTKGTMDPAIIRAFKDAGWTWGGDFRSRRDPMHFQLAKGV